MRSVFKQIMVVKVSFQIYYNKHMDMKNKCKTKYM